jgi:hypothetical protein
VLDGVHRAPERLVHRVQAHHGRDVGHLGHQPCRHRGVGVLEARGCPEGVEAVRDVGIAVVEEPVSLVAHEGVIGLLGTGPGREAGESETLPEHVLVEVDDHLQAERLQLQHVGAHLGEVGLVVDPLLRLHRLPEHQEPNQGDAVRGEQRQFGRFQPVMVLGATLRVVVEVHSPVHHRAPVLRLPMPRMGIWRLRHLFRRRTPEEQQVGQEHPGPRDSRLGGSR